MAEQHEEVVGKRREQLSDDERKARRKMFYKSFVDYLSKKIAADLRRHLAYDEEREILAVRDKFQKKVSLVKGEADATAWRRMKSLKTDEQWREAIKKWDEDRAREKKERDECIKRQIQIEDEMNAMLASGMSRSEVVEKIKKKYSSPSFSSSHVAETIDGE